MGDAQASVQPALINKQLCFAWSGRMAEGCDVMAAKMSCVKQHRSIECIDRGI